MKVQLDKRKENISRSIANETSNEPKGAKPAFQFVDNRSEVVSQRKLNDIANNFSGTHQKVHQKKKVEKVTTNGVGVVQRAYEKGNNNKDQIDRMKISLDKIVNDLGDDGKSFKKARLTLTEIKTKNNTIFDQDHVHKFEGILDGARKMWKVKFDKKECPY